VILSSKLDLTSKPPSATNYPATVNKGMQKEIPMVNNTIIYVELMIGGIL
jgi:hypothetical protein